MKWNIYISSVILVTKFLTCCAQMGFPWQRRAMFRPPLFPAGSLLRLNRNRFQTMNRRFPFLPSPNMPFGDRNAFMNRPDTNRFGPPQSAFTPGNPNPAIPGPSTTGQANSNRVGNIRTMFPNSERNPTPTNDFTRFQARSGGGTFSNFQSNTRNRQVPSQNGLPSSNNFLGFQGRRANQLNMSPRQIGGSIGNQQRQFQQQSQGFQQRPQIFPQQPQRFPQRATRQQQQQISRFPMNPFSRQALGRGATNFGRRQGQMPLRPQGMSPIAPVNQWRSPAMTQNNFQGNRNIRPGFDPIRNQVLTQTGRSNIASNRVIQSPTVLTTPPMPAVPQAPQQNFENIFSSQQALEALGMKNNQAESSGPNPPPPPGTQILPENFDPSKLPKGTEVQSMVTITNEKGDIIYRGYDLNEEQINSIANEIAENMTKNFETPSPNVTPPVPQIVTVNANTPIPNQNTVVKNPGIIGESKTFAGSGSQTDPLANMIADPSGSTTSARQGAELQNSPFFQPPRVPSRPRNRSRGPLQFLDVNQNTGSSQTSMNDNIGLFQSFLADPGNPGAV